MASAEFQRELNGPPPEPGGDTLRTADADSVIARIQSVIGLLNPGSTQVQMLRDALATLRTLRDDADSVAQRFLGLINAVPDAVTVIDTEGNVLEANDAACRIYGRTRAELTRLTIWDMNPDAPPERMQQIAADFAVGDVFTIEASNTRGDGSRFPVEVHSSVFLDRGEWRVIAVARDITQRRAAEDEIRASEARYRSLLQVMDKGILVQNAQGHVISVNPAACRILGQSEDEFKDPDNRWLQWYVVAEDGRPVARDDMPAFRALREGRTQDSTVLGVYNRRGDRYVWLDVTSTPQVRDGESAPFQVISTFSDITGLKRDSELFVQTQALARIGGWEWMPQDGEQMYWTREVHRILELDPATPTDLESFIAHIAPVDRARVRAIFADARQRGGAFEFEGRIVTGRGNSRWIRLLGSAALRDNLPFRASGTLQDITSARLREEELQRQALTDPLTGLPNRDSILDRIGLTLADRESACAVLYVDLDRFKVINELVGHTAGDSLLVAAARRLRECVGTGATVARFGGDEFLVLVESRTREDVEQLAERVVVAFGTPFRYGDEEFSITTSVGLAMSPEHGDTAHQLLQSADTAAAEAKRRGRNAWHMFSSVLADRLSDRLRIESQLRKALELGEFRLVYQPQVDLATGRPCAAEALIRWHNRVLGEMRPDRFIAHAENTGDIVRIGAWVIREACSQMARWCAEGAAVERVAVNVSYRQFLSEDLPDIVVQALHEHGLPGSMLELEMTERVVIEDAADTLEIFNALKRLGVVMTIDDFGEGYSALSYLRRLPIDGLKISYGFVRGVPDNRSDAGICRAIVGIAESLGLGVTAEGVETEPQRRYLHGLGIPRGQGYLFSAPRTPDQFREYLARTG